MTNWFIVWHEAQSGLCFLTPNQWEAGIWRIHPNIKKLITTHPQPLPSDMIWQPESSLLEQMTFTHLLLPMQKRPASKCCAQGAWPRLETQVEEIREMSHRFLMKTLFIQELAVFATCSFSYHVNRSFSFPRTINSYEKLYKQHECGS